jgi:hypothetical protein
VRTPRRTYLDIVLGIPATAPRPDGWGPWRLPLGDPERAPQFRSLAALSSLLLYSAPLKNAFVDACRDAERCDVSAARAYRILMTEVPTVPRRRILSTFSSVNYRRSQPANSRPVALHAASTP